jgi:hypothetical protein
MEEPWRPRMHFSSILQSREQVKGRWSNGVGTSSVSLKRHGNPKHLQVCSGENTPSDSKRPMVLGFTPGQPPSGICDMTSTVSAKTKMLVPTWSASGSDSATSKAIDPRCTSLLRIRRIRRS